MNEVSETGGDGRPRCALGWCCLQGRTRCGAVRGGRGRCLGLCRRLTRQRRCRHTHSPLPAQCAGGIRIRGSVTCTAQLGLTSGGGAAHQKHRMDGLAGVLTFRCQTNSDHVHQLGRPAPRRRPSLASNDTLPLPPQLLLASTIHQCWAGLPDCWRIDAEGFREPTSIARASRPTSEELKGHKKFANKFDELITTV